VSFWSATFLLVWGVVGLPEEDALPASLIEEIFASRVEARVSTPSSGSDSDPVSVISSHTRVSLLKAAHIPLSDYEVQETSLDNFLVQVLNGSGKRQIVNLQ
jgi:hypothetical protein